MIGQLKLSNAKKQMTASCKLCHDTAFVSAPALQATRFVHRACAFQALICSQHQADSDCHSLALIRCTKGICQCAGCHFRLYRLHHTLLCHTLTLDNNATLLVCKELSACIDSAGIFQPTQAAEPHSLKLDRSTITLLHIWCSPFIDPAGLCLSPCRQ